MSTSPLRISAFNPGPYTGEGNNTWLLDGDLPTLIDAGTGKPPLYPNDDTVVAVAGDRPLPGLAVPVVALDDVEAVATMVLEKAEPLAAVLARLEAGN